jgi:hypothetical protein
MKPHTALEPQRLRLIEKIENFLRGHLIELRLADRVEEFSGPVVRARAEPT